MLAAGYSEGTAATGQKPEDNGQVLAAIEALTARRLRAAAPVALKLIEDLVGDKTIAPRVRLDAAKTLLDRAGYTPPNQAADKAPLSPAEMTAEQLREFIADGERALADRAQVINGEATESQPTTQLTDFLT